MEKKDKHTRELLTKWESGEDVKHNFSGIMTYKSMVSDKYIKKRTTHIKRHGYAGRGQQNADDKKP